jgi:hypothetical protein
MAVYTVLFTPSPGHAAERPLALLSTTSEDWNLTSPNPRIFGLVPNQSSPNRILTNIIHSLRQAFIRSKNMIEELFLPNGTAAI